MPGKILPDRSSSKGKIIFLLADEKGLSVKRIHNLLKNRENYASSYQSTHKTIKQMVEEKILLRNENNYFLNAEWLKGQLDSLSSLVLLSGQGKEAALERIGEKDSATNSFETVSEAGGFLIDRVMGLPNPERKPCLCLWRFCYSVLAMDQKHLEALKQVLNAGDWRIMVQESSKVDRMFGEILESYGARRINYGVKNCATELSDKFVVGDFVTEIIYPKAVRKSWELYYKLPRQVAQLRLGKILEGTRFFKAKIHVITTKNRELANEYRKQYL